MPARVICAAGGYEAAQRNANHALFGTHAVALKAAGATFWVSGMSGQARGEMVRGDSDDDLVANVTAHVDRHHPELVGKLSRDGVLAMAEATA